MDDEWRLSQFNKVGSPSRDRISKKKNVFFKDFKMTVTFLVFNIFWWVFFNHIYCFWNVHFWGYCCPLLPWGVSKNGIPEGHKPKFNRKGIYQEIMLIFCSVKISDLKKKIFHLDFFSNFFFLKSKFCQESKNHT